MREGGEPTVGDIIPKRDCEILTYICKSYGHIPIDHFVYYFPDGIDMNSNVLYKQLCKVFQNHNQVLNVMTEFRNRWHQSFMGIANDMHIHAQELRKTISLIMSCSTSSSNTTIPYCVTTSQTQTQTQTQQTQNMICISSPFEIISSQQLARTDYNCNIVELEYSLYRVLSGWVFTSLYHGNYHIVNTQTLSGVSREVMRKVCGFKSYKDVKDAYDGKTYAYREIIANDPIMGIDDISEIFISGSRGN